MSSSDHFKVASIKTRGTALLIEHAPCCFLSIAASIAGVSFLNHNPALELGFAIVGAITGEYIGDKYIAKDCQHESEAANGASNFFKKYGTALAFGLATWGAHQVLLHDHEEHEYAEHIEQIIPKCDGPGQHLIYLPERPHEHSGEEGHNHDHSHGPVCAFR